MCGGGTPIPASLPTPSHLKEHPFRLLISHPNCHLDELVTGGHTVKVIFGHDLAGAELIGKVWIKTFQGNIWLLIEGIGSM
jgi:hypothetical protein